MRARLAVLVVSPLLLLFSATEGLAAQSRTADQTIQLYQSRVAKAPGDFANYAKLGAAYLQKGQETEDVTFYTLAEETLKRSLELGADPGSAAAAHTSLAIVYSARQQFQDALAHAQKALEYGDPDLLSYGVLGDVYVEIGEYEKAEDAYAKLLGVRGARYPHSGLSRLRFLRGDPQGAIREMQRGIAGLREASALKADLVRGQVQLGELQFQVGDLPNSESAYRDALKSLPSFHRALAGLARVRAAQQSYPEAIRLYQEALGVVPLPVYAAALGDVYAKIGQPEEAKRQYDLVERIGYLSSIHNKVVYDRERAFIYADHDLKLSEALELAERELEVRWDVYTYDVLAWALYKNGRLRDALWAIKEALRAGTQDARLFFHAGVIRRALGEDDTARAYLQRALATNASFDLLHVDGAQRILMELGGRLSPR